MNNLLSDYQTTDTALAAYLIVESFPLLEIDYTKPRYEFTFQDNPNDINKHATLYISGLARVDPATYNRVKNNLVRILKNQLQWVGVQNA